MEGKKIIANVRVAAMKEIVARKAQFDASYAHIPQTDPSVKVAFGAETYTLEFSFAAVQAFYRATGENLNALRLTAEDLENDDLLLNLVTAGLQLHHQGITKDEVAAMMPYKHKAYYQHVLGKALEVTQPAMDMLEDILGDLEKVANVMEAEDGEGSGPLPEIVPSPIFGQPAED